MVGCKTPTTGEAQSKSIPPHLIRPLEFADFTISEITSLLGVSNLWSQKIKIGTQEPDAYDFLSRNETNKIHVETVNEYRAGIKAGYGANTTADMATESWFIQADRVLSFMEQARPSQHSLFATKDLKYLPVSILNWTEKEAGDQLNQDAAKGQTLKDCTKANTKHHLHELKIKDHTMTFSDDACDYNVEELARGDFDHDSFEDSLILVATYYQGGSGRNYQAFVVSRTNSNQRQLKLTALDAANWGQRITMPE